MKKHVREVLENNYGEPKTLKTVFTGRRAAKRARRHLRSPAGNPGVSNSEIDKFVRMDILGDEDELDTIEKEP